MICCLIFRYPNPCLSTFRTLPIKMQKNNSSASKTSVVGPRGGFARLGRLAFYGLATAVITAEAHAGVSIPGTSLSIGTKTVAGWLLFVTIIFLATRAIMVSMSSADERSKEERDDKIKAAWIAFGSGLMIFGALVAMGLISLTDVTSAASQF